MSGVIIRIVKRATRGVYILLFCVIFFFAGCSREETAGEESLDKKTENTGESGLENASEENLISCEFTDVYLRITEPYGSSYILNGNVSQTAVEEHTYQFASDIEEEDCLSFIQAQEKLCAFLEEKGIPTVGMLYRVLTDYSNWTDSDEAMAYFGLNTVESWEQVLTTIQVSLGDYTNYGYLYALANDVAEELGWETDAGISNVIDVDNLKEYPSLLNLVYPCFDLMYEDEETIQTCKALALQILERLADPYAGEEAFTEEIETWAQEQGGDFTSTYLRFAYYSESCPLKMATQYLEIFRDADFVAEASYEDGQITYNYFENVSVMLQAFEWLDVQLEYYCEKLDAYPENLAVVQLTGKAHMQSLYPNFAGMYAGVEGEVNIYTYEVCTLGHEYLHHLYHLKVDIVDKDYGWCSEVISYYYAGDHYEIMLRYANVIPEYSEEEIISRIGRILEEPSDYICLLRVLYREMEDPQYHFSLESDSGVGYKCAFGEYFVRTYGEEAFINSMLQPLQAEEYTGKTLDEIIEDWSVDMANPEMDELVRYENFCTMW